jgi:hypothetical protein
MMAEPFDPTYDYVVLREMTRTVRIPISGFARYEKALGLAMRQAVFGKSMRTAGKLVREYMEAETIKRGIFHRKRFARSWRMVIGNVPSSARVYNKMPYASVIEYGRRPNSRRPPVDALVPWVRDKFGVRGKEARSVAFLVARKIGIKGIKARPVARDPKVQAKVMKIVTRTVQEKLRAAIARTR